MPRGRKPRPIAERFWSRVEKGPDCWIWTGAKIAGYGAIKPGPIPDGMKVCHRCDNPPCCNPAHLFLGTQAENVRDRDAKRRQARGERQGQSKLTAAQVREIRAALPFRGVNEELARRFGVSGANISIIRAGKSWRPAHAR